MEQNLCNVLDFAYSFDSDPGAGVVKSGKVAGIEGLLRCPILGRGHPIIGHKSTPARPGDSLKLL
jgi:hypothetical protein